MSIILDALKKLDRERSGRPDGPPNIGTEILRPDPPLRGKRTPLYFATILLTAVAATAITYAVVVWFGFPSKSGPPPSMSFPAPKQPVKPASPETISTSKSGPPPSMSSPAPKQPVKPASPEAISLPKSGPPASMNSSAPSQQDIPNPPSHEPARASGEEISPESSKIQNPPENKNPATPLGEKKGDRMLSRRRRTLFLETRGKASNLSRADLL